MNTQPIGFPAMDLVKSKLKGLLFVANLNRDKLSC